MYQEQSTFSNINYTTNASSNNNNNITPTVSNPELRMENPVKSEDLVKANADFSSLQKKRSDHIDFAPIQQLQNNDSNRHHIDNKAENINSNFSN